MQSELAARIFGDRADPSERLQQLFDDYSTTMGAPPSAREWTAKVLRDRKIDPKLDPEDAVIALRRAYPRLTPKVARYLVEDARQR
ncbi:MAG: hypothetical protein KJ659_06755 [Actinobacteria bacterium]|nr:hypothetical protein [Actinomycetota bacterium]MBU1609837.1 hypothetical protein [Actinomycetota bacterium]MBU2315934.1 hypothetical protein [Actinomycetota bacterium]MBU2385186.1 hypothetical protein [Actinomycetota bacterium]